MPRGRSLIAVGSGVYANESLQAPIYTNTSLINTTHHHQLNASSTPRCANSGRKTPMNLSESIRLNNDLMDWFDRHEPMMNTLQLRRAGSLLYPSPSLLFPQDYYDFDDESTGWRKVGPRGGGYGVERGDGGGSKGKLVHGRRRSTWEKKESARLKAVRDRAWRHLGMISTGQAPVEVNITDEQGKSSNRSQR